MGSTAPLTGRPQKAKLGGPGDGKALVGVPGCPLEALDYYRCLRGSQHMQPDIVDRLWLSTLCDQLQPCVQPMLLHFILLAALLGRPEQADLFDLGR